MPSLADQRPGEGRATALQELKELEAFLGEQLGRLRAAGSSQRTELVHALEEIHAILGSGLQLVEAHDIQRRQADALARAAAERAAAAHVRKQAAAVPTPDEEIPLAADELLLDYDEELEFLQRQEQLPALILPTRLRAGPRAAPCLADSVAEATIEIDGGSLIAPAAATQEDP